MHGRGCAWQEGVHGREVHGRGRAWQGGVHGIRDGHCSGRYASYWNAFLFIIKVVVVVPGQDFSEMERGSYLPRGTIPMKSRTFWHPLIFYAPYLYSNNQGHDTANNSDHSNEVRTDGTACHVAIAPARSVVSHLKRVDKVGPWDMNTIHFFLKHFQYLENIVHLQSFTISNLSVFHGEDCVPYDLVML